MKNVGEKLKELREADGKTKAELARILGFKYMTYSSYEHNKRQMPYAAFIKIADYYDISLDELFGRKEY